MKRVDMSTVMMEMQTPPRPADDDIRFLEYRLEVVRHWPPSARKQATLEAVSRRLTALARAGLASGPMNDDLVALSCRLLDGVFSDSSDAGRA